MMNENFLFHPWFGCTDPGCGWFTKTDALAYDVIVQEAFQTASCPICHAQVLFMNRNSDFIYEQEELEGEE